MSVFLKIGVPKYAFSTQKNFILGNFYVGKPTKVELSTAVLRAWVSSCLSKVGVVELTLQQL